MGKGKFSWIGKKQISLMLFTALIMLVGACLGGGCTNTIIPVIAEKYAWDVNVLRSWCGVGTCLVVVGSFIFSQIIIKKGAKLAITISLFVTAAMCVVYGYTSSYPAFILCILVIGIMSGGYYQAGMSNLTNNWFPTKKGIVLGITTMAIPFMDIVWQPVIPIAFNKVGTEKTMIVVAILVAILALFGLRIKNTPEEAGEYPDGDAENAEEIAKVVKEMKEYKSPFTIQKVLSTPSAWGIAISMGLCFMVAMTYIASIVPRMLSCGYQYTQATTVLIACGVFAMIGSYLIGVMDQKLGTKKACLTFMVVLGIGMVIAQFHAKGMAFVWASSLIFSVANGGCGNLIPSSVGSIFGRWDYASVYRIVGPITSLCAGIGVVLTGVFHNYQMMYRMDLVLMIIAIVVMACTSFKFLGKRG